MCLAIPGQVVELTDEFRRLAAVEVAGVRRVVNIGLLDGDEGGVGPGDWVLVHVGFAMSRIDEREAAATLELLRAMGGEFEAELEEFERSRIR
jgi:hydrogenase expression/formation protein HypC